MSVCQPSASTSASEAPAPHRLRWVMISLVFLATVINYLDRQTLSVVAPILRGQFQMSHTSYSRIVFTLFGLIPLVSASIVLTLPRAVRLRRAEASAE